MNLTKSLKRYLQPMVRFAETPRRFTRNSVGHLRVALFFKLPKNYVYEPRFYKRGAVACFLQALF